MSLSKERKDEVTQVINNSIREKLRSYSPETTYKPFHDFLIGADRMNLFSFIHSINTTFGTSIYEPVAKAVGKEKFVKAESQKQPFTRINKDAQLIIQKILDEIETGKRKPDKVRETFEIQEAILTSSNDASDVNFIKADIWLEDNSGGFHLIDIKTVKPNKNSFRSYKRILLEWLAAELTRKIDNKIYTYIGIPYNPYFPKKYDRWTLNGMFDIKNEVLVAEELWDFIGGEGIYSDLLECFKSAGETLKIELDDYFSKFRMG
jgi:hypothetical protein